MLYNIHTLGVILWVKLLDQKSDEGGSLSQGRLAELGEERTTIRLVLGATESCIAGSDYASALIIELIGPTTQVRDRHFRHRQSFGWRLFNIELRVNVSNVLVDNVSAGLWQRQRGEV